MFVIPGVQRGALHPDLGETVHCQLLSLNSATVGQMQPDQHAGLMVVLRIARTPRACPEPGRHTIQLSQLRIRTLAARSRAWPELALDRFGVLSLAVVLIGLVLRPVQELAVISGPIAARHRRFSTAMPSSATRSRFPRPVSRYARCGIIYP